MTKSQFSEKQIAFVLKQAEPGTPVPEVCRKPGISGATFCTWCKKYGGISPLELKHMHLREEENLRLKKRVANLSSDKTMLQDVQTKRNRHWQGCLNRAGSSRHVTEPANGKSVLRCRSATVRSAKRFGCRRQCVVPAYWRDHANPSA